MRPCGRAVSYEPDGFADPPVYSAIGRILQHGGWSMVVLRHRSSNGMPSKKATLTISPSHTSCVGCLRLSAYRTLSSVRVGALQVFLLVASAFRTVARAHESAPRIQHEDDRSYKPAIASAARDELACLETLLRRRRAPPRDLDNGARYSVDVDDDRRLLWVLRHSEPSLQLGALLAARFGRAVQCARVRCALV